MTTQQFQLFETVPTDASAKRRIRQEKAKQARGVEQILSQMRNLREQLNDRLYTTAGERPTINSPADAAALVQYDLSPLDHEELHVLILDRRNKVLKIVRLYVGSVNSSQVRVGEVFRDAIQLNASAIIPTHNHPSGDPTPSPDDVAVTRAMVQAGKLLDIEVLDHLVIGAGRWCSLKERGLGFA
jgi:DNA repair protein RadC